MEMVKMIKYLALSLILILHSASLALAESEIKESKPIQISTSVEKQPLVQAEKKVALKESIPSNSVDLSNYTLGPDDVVEITIFRHPEFSGVYPVNLEGKIQYKFVGDMSVDGLTKSQLQVKIKDIISNFVVNPEVSVTITEYKSKVIYVLGEVGRPGKYYMRSDSIQVREAVVQAGLPTLAAAMRKCRIISPDKNGKVKTRNVDLYAVLYGGNLRFNYEMKAGDVLYVPSTVMAKLFRVISPVTSTVAGAAGAPESVSTGKTAITNIAR